MQHRQIIDRKTFGVKPVIAYRHTYVLYFPSAFSCSRIRCCCFLQRLSLRLTVFFRTLYNVLSLKITKNDRFCKVEFENKE